MRVHTARPLRADRAAPWPSAAPGVPEAVSDPPLDEVSEDPLQGQVTALGPACPHLPGAPGWELRDGWRRAHRVRLARAEGRDDGCPEPAERCPADVTGRGTGKPTRPCWTPLPALSQDPGCGPSPTRGGRCELAPGSRVRSPTDRTKSQGPDNRRGPQGRARPPGALYSKSVRVMIQHITRATKRA